jgi:hypothetical protein
MTMAASTALRLDKPYVRNMAHLKAAKVHRGAAQQFDCQRRNEESMRD